MQNLEDTSQAKKAWSDNVRTVESQSSINMGRGQELKHLKDKGRVQTFLSLLTRVGARRTPRWEREKVFYVKV